jgi:hypothetical protein
VSDALLGGNKYRFVGNAARLDLMLAGVRPDQEVASNFSSR